VAQALDASGNVVDQKINYALATVPGSVAPTSTSGVSPRRITTRWRCGTRTSCRGADWDR